MNRILALRPVAKPLSLLMALFSTLTLSSCSRRNEYGNLTLWGGIYYVLALLAILDIFRQPWSLVKKLIWILIVFIPFGIIIYFLFAGRGKS
jgi:cell division protein FtsW (lipid II flippase)